jgi:hypothetical protein
MVKMIPSASCCGEEDCIRFPGPWLSYILLIIYTFLARTLIERLIEFVNSRIQTHIA